MARHVSELNNIRVLTSRPYKFRPELIEQKDAQGNLGLNAVLSYQYLAGETWREIPIRIEVDPNINWMGHIPYSFQFLPPLERSVLVPRVPADRDFPIIRIVAAPGVKIYLPPPKVGLFNLSNPMVEVIRVQDVGLVPPLGRDINTYNFINTTFVDPLPTSLHASPSEQHVRVETLRNGVDIVQDMFHNRLIVRVKSDGASSGSDRFLYKFVKHSGRSILVLMATESVKVELQLTGAIPFQRLRSVALPIDNRRVDIEYIPVPNLFTFNILAKYFFLEDFYRDAERTDVISKAPIPITYVPNTDDIIGLSILDGTIGLVPVFGDLYDLAQFAYGVANGSDFHGVKVSNVEIVVMGLLVLLPFVPVGLARGAGIGKKALNTLGPKADVVDALAAGMVLGRNEEKLLNDASNLLAKGRKLPVKLVEDIVKEVQFPPAKLYVVDDLLDASKSNFTHPKLQEKYRMYLAEQARQAKKAVASGGEIKSALPPEHWAKKQTQGEASELLEGLLGVGFRKTPKTVSHGKFPYINASEIIRPSSLDNVRLEQFIRKIVDDPSTLLRKVPAEKVVNGKISKELFDTIKGNVGEILAKEYKNILVASRRAEFGDGMELFENVKIVIKKADNGKFTDEFWEFTDGLIGGLNRNGDFVIKDIIEIKAGTSVANKVQKQVFEWVEDKISEGARIRLPDGRIFDYFPSDPKVKRVIGLANARRHVINPQGKSHIGMRSSDQIAAQIQRLELPADPEEIKFLTALVQNTQHVQLKTTNAELDYLVAELAQRISEFGVLMP